MKFNSEWMDRMTAADMVAWPRLTPSRACSSATTSPNATRPSSRSPFTNCYPLVQGYDSVALKADLELGGTDQKFNLLMGREVQKHHGQPPQCILTMPLLEGTGGVNKMSKSLGNHIGIAEPPGQIFGKLMSISDDLMWRYIELLSFEAPQKMKLKKQAVLRGAIPGTSNSRSLQEIVERFHGRTQASLLQEILSPGSGIMRRPRTCHQSRYVPLPGVR